ncbi:Superoxide dismutase [Cu-Zn] [Mycolicibacterium vanbaalenii]|uniref:Superoxide dismutase [Cu-Zn] n=1 Tax=Mycolicibacterium vanbaalenii TaxID=110539 RepID=A0A5S9R939_MYCVN|nr:superoxide dismutase family protein [Mycolicibacterium vanbaalenii]CAA0134481.1 Superoxide dismutase [Cu-Zn] [Mycolicibacterium vanbaalenii]
MFKPVTFAMLLATPALLLTACGSDDSAGEETPTAATSEPGGPPPGAERLTAQLATADGTEVANATFDFADGFATVTVETVAPDILSPGFHGMHIHSVGRCEPDSEPPGGGQRGDFLSAGGHFQAPGHSGHPASGDLTSLEVRSDGSARLVTTTDAFTADELLAGEKTALMIHEGSDNFANIPPRYTIDGTPGPDEETLATGDAGGRVACGVIAAAAVATTTTTTMTETTSLSPTTETETTVVVPPPATTDTETETVTPTTTTPPQVPSPPPVPEIPDVPDVPAVPNVPNVPGPGNP